MRKECRSKLSYKKFWIHKTFEFYSIDKEETLKISEQSNVDLAEIDRIYFERRRKLEVMG